MGTSLCLAAATPINLARNGELVPTKLWGDNFAGHPFDDTKDLLLLHKRPFRVKKLTLQGMERLDAIAFTLEGDEGDVEYRHGGNGGFPRTLKLKPEEYITRVYLCRDKYEGRWNSSYRIYYIEAHTNIPSKSIKTGEPPSKGKCTTIEATDKRALVGVFGRAGREIDQLGFITAPR